jgi:hypothetical protein
LPYRFPRVPTTNDPIADVMSERFMNAFAAKWLDAQPAQAITIMMGSSRANRGCWFLSERARANPGHARKSAELAVSLG